VEHRSNINIFFKKHSEFPKIQRKKLSFSTQKQYHWVNQGCFMKKSNSGKLLFTFVLSAGFLCISLFCFSAFLAFKHAPHHAMHNHHAPMASTTQDAVARSLFSAHKSPKADYADSAHAQSSFRSRVFVQQFPHYASHIAIQGLKNFYNNTLTALWNPQVIDLSVAQAVNVIKILEETALVSLTPKGPTHDQELSHFVNQSSISSVYVDGDTSKIRMNQEVFSLNSIVHSKNKLRLTEIAQDSIVFTDENGLIYEKSL
jgi:hypothetical protein